VERSARSGVERHHRTVSGALAQWRRDGGVIPRFSPMLADNGAPRGSLDGWHAEPKFDAGALSGASIATRA
jgi:hypothetical protein